jgi:hypothetical protein
MLNHKKMKNLSALFLCMLFVYTVDAQSNNFEKIEVILKKNLEGKGFLRGMYDPPCYALDKLQVAANGDIVITGEKGCTVTFSVKDARISSEDSKVKIFRVSQGTIPKINISFYTENAAAVSKAFTDLKNMLSTAEKGTP